MARLRFRPSTLAHAAGSLALAASLGLGTQARAAEVTRVVSALDPGKKVDIDVKLSYFHDSKSAAVKREFQSALSPGRTELVKDLRFQQSRDVLALRADFGIFWDLGLHIDLPVVVNDARQLDFDQDLGSDCVFANDPSGLRPTCVNEQNSSLLRDGVLPGFQKPNYGFDATSKGKAFAKPSKTVFKGPARNGLEYLGLGATWAIFNQKRDDSKPTWTVTLDARLDVGTDMRFDPAKPDGNTGVGRGYHQLYYATFVSKRLRYFEPYFGGYYLMPLRTSGSPFEHYVGSQTNVNPQHVGGMSFGAEGIVWEKPEASQKVFVDLRGRIEGRFEGREHSELWEALSGSSACKTDPMACRKDIDQDMNRDGKADPFPGVTDIETYGVFGGDVGLGIQPNKNLVFHGLFGLTLEQPHFITFADAGQDLNADGKVDTDSATESNPVYREVFDLPGRRFRVDQTQIWSFYLSASYLF